MGYGFRSRQLGISTPGVHGKTKEIADLLNEVSYDLLDQQLTLPMPGFISPRTGDVYSINSISHGIEVHLRMIGVWERSTQEKVYLRAEVINLKRKASGHPEYCLFEGPIPYDHERIVRLLRGGIREYKRTQLNPQ